jgi:hypothetical protein
MLRKPTRLHTRDLTWNPADRTFVAEASSLPDPSAAFDDACDVGYTLVSERTGRELVVVLNGRILGGEGELEYEVYTESDHRGPKRNPLVELHVYND